MQLTKLSWLPMAILAMMLSSCGYNAMVEKETQVEKSWANVESAYQRRADLIPQLVSTVQGAADFETGLLTEVIEARSKATGIEVNVDDLTPENIEKFQAAQGNLNSALSRLLVTVERYPDIKANQNFRDFQQQLESTENRINVERNKFNEAVGNFNAYIRKFPQLIYAGWFGFQKKGFFESDSGAEEAPDVEFEF